jgi:peptide/nickel transport system ATP-binding protein
LPETLLEVNNLKKHFKTKKGPLHAVDDISFKIQKGETLGLVGESGCGKPTTGRVILKLTPSTDGEVNFEGNDILKYNKKQTRSFRESAQFVFQDPFASLNPRMSVSEIIGEPLKIYKKSSNRTELREMVFELMETVGLVDRYENVYPHELDGGRRQRIGVARALALNPSFIVLDEPVSALDVSIQAQVLNLLQDLQEKFGLTYLFISHDLSVIKHMSDNIAVMYLGKIVEMTDYQTLFENPTHPYTRALLSAIPIPNPEIRRERIILEGDVPSPISPPPGCRFYGRCYQKDESCKEIDPELNEVSNGHHVACHKAV